MGHRATPSCSSEAKRRRKAAWVLQLHLAPQQLMGFSGK